MVFMGLTPAGGGFAGAGLAGLATVVGMTADHTRYEELARDRRSRPEYREGYAEAARAFLIGQAVRDRRLALGLSQSDVASRAGMTMPALSRLEAGGVIPTIPVLGRISAALDAELVVTLAPRTA
jgi:ribosome-binding protein aMBF1 (putative translation factor)